MIYHVGLPLQFEGCKATIFEHFSITERERRLRFGPRVTLRFFFVIGLVVLQQLGGRDLQDLRDFEQ